MYVYVVISYHYVSDLSCLQNTHEPSVDIDHVDESVHNDEDKVGIL